MHPIKPNYPDQLERFRDALITPPTGQGSIEAQRFYEMPRIQGMYFFYGSADELIYIGISRKLRGRIGYTPKGSETPIITHSKIRTDAANVRIGWLEFPQISRDDLEMLEAIAIICFKPPKNGSKTNWLDIGAHRAKVKDAYQELIKPGCLPELLEAVPTGVMVDLEDALLNLASAMSG